MLGCSLSDFVVMLEASRREREPLFRLSGEMVAACNRLLRRRAQKQQCGSAITQLAASIAATIYQRDSGKRKHMTTGKSSLRRYRQVCVDRFPLLDFPGFLCVRRGGGRVLNVASHNRPCGHFERRQWEMRGLASNKFNTHGVLA